MGTIARDQEAPGTVTQTRVALAGLGAVAHRIHIPACRAVREIALVGGCDIDPAARTRAAALGIGSIAESLDQLVAETRPDALIVGTPPSTHAEVCRRALEAGLHVFCEKPFAATVEEADALIALARQRNRLVRVNNQYRFMRIYAKTRDRLEHDEFGRPYYIQAWQQMYHPPEVETNWRRSLRQNTLFEFGTHAFDLASCFFDAMPIAVQAHTPAVRQEFQSDVVAHVTLRFPGERLAVFSFNRVSHAPEKYFEMRVDCDRASLRLSLGGVAKTAIEWSRRAKRPVVSFGLAKGGQARAERDGRSRAYASAPASTFADATAEHLRLFHAELQTPTKSLAAAEHARDLLRVVSAAYESARTGETVRL